MSCVCFGDGCCYLVAVFHCSIRITVDTSYFVSLNLVIKLPSGWIIPVAYDHYNCTYSVGKSRPFVACRITY